MTVDVDLRLGDCLELLPTIAAGSVDAIIADLPYGTTACKWDTVIPFVPLWEQYKRIIKPRGAIVLFGSQPFTSALVMSNVGWFKYCWIWKKTKAVNFMHCHNAPLKVTEDIIVFSGGSIRHQGQDGRMPYNPQHLIRVNKQWSRPQKYASEHNLSRPSHSLNRIVDYTNYPDNVLRYGSVHNSPYHPTQKPVALLEYLIRTYTNEGETVLDNTMGSGTTGVACIKTGRNFIGIELDKHYYDITVERIEFTRNEAVQLSILEEVIP